MIGSLWHLPPLSALVVIRRHVPLRLGFGLDIAGVVVPAFELPRKPGQPAVAVQIPVWKTAVDMSEEVNRIGHRVAEPQRALFLPLRPEQTARPGLDVADRQRIRQDRR